MKAFVSDRVELPLPPGHRFPIEKDRLLRESLTAGAAEPGLAIELVDAVPASDADLLRVHLPGYVAAVRGGTLSAKEQRRIGFPWSPELVERSLLSVGATLGACRAALVEGVAVTLAGGTHHAFADHGEGYCVFNDAAVAVRALQAAGAIQRALIVDTDVHQGNGTAAIFRDDPTVFTLSLHGAGNYPFHKEASDLDVELPDGCGDADYLDALARALVAALAAAAADLVVVVAGADPFLDDRLGRLALTKEGLAERDRRVLAACADHGLPVAVTMGGGYARDVRDTVEIQRATIHAALRLASLRGATMRR